MEMRSHVVPAQAMELESWNRLPARSVRPMPTGGRVAARKEARHQVTRRYGQLLAPGVERLERRLVHRNIFTLAGVHFTSKIRVAGSLIFTRTRSSSRSR